MKKTNILILIPTYNDWDSLELLIPEIESKLKDEEISLTFSIIDDASIQEFHTLETFLNKIKVAKKIDIVRLNCNMGHQRAIAIGLAHAANTSGFDLIIIMDSDGEDRPEDILLLLEKYRQEKNTVIVARRDKRSEGKLFRIGYFLYRLIFRILTGKRVEFGNFSLIPKQLLERLVFRDSLWNHLPASILRSKLPISMVPTKRGTRLKGKAKMNLPDLVLLGLSAVSVYSDVAFLRTLSVSIFLSLLTVAGIATTVIIRFFTELAIPGWASTVVGSLVIILILSLVMSVSVLFIVLASRSQYTIIPAKHAKDFIKSIDTIYQK